MSDNNLRAAIAAHPPTYTDYAADPTATFYCKPCSEAAGEWVTWTPEHVAAALAPLLAAREQAARAEAWDARNKARPQYLGPAEGHYEDCMGYGDCHCGSYPNPYRDGGE